MVRFVNWSLEEEKCLMIRLHSFGVPRTHTYAHILGGFHSDAIELTRCCFTVGLTDNMYCNLRVLIT